MTALLEVHDLTVRHGQLEAVRAVNLSLSAGEVVAIIGANGAGKSTLLRAIAGLHPPASGSVRLDGTDITHLGPEKRVAAGIVLVPEGRRLFSSLTVEENLLAGLYRARPGAWDMARVAQLFPWVQERRRQPASQLSGGEQQAVAIARALLANPRVLLLDEPSLGLSPLASRRIYSVLPELVSSGLGILLVEQDVRQALRVADRLQCLLEGRQTLEGKPGEVDVEEIETAYFGIVGGAGSVGSAGSVGGAGRVGRVGSGRPA